MINEQLYQALQKAFGEVLIANEGEMPTVVPDPVGYPGWRIASSTEGGRGEQYHVNCPFCNDKRHRLYISSLSYATITIGGEQLPGALIAYCQNENCLSKGFNRNALEQMIRGKLSAVPVVTGGRNEEQGEAPKYSSSPTVEGIRTWVSGYTPVDKNAPPAIIDYLNSRRISHDDLQWLRIGWGPIQTKHGLLLDGRPWVIFPVVQNGNLVGVQARCPDCYMPANFKMKYWFHPASKKSAAVFNLDIARSLGTGVLCEGVFDVASVGKPGICCFGHTPSVVQRRLIASVGDLLIWVPDTDSNPQCNPVEIARKFADQWNQTGAFRLGVHIVLLPQKDAGAMTRLQVWHEIMKQVPSNVAGFLMNTVVGRL